MTVRLFADECIASSTIARLRAAGFDVISATDVNPSVDDEQILTVAHREGRVLQPTRTSANSSFVSSARHSVSSILLSAIWQLQLVPSLPWRD